jgi:signal peptidase I
MRKLAIVSIFLCLWLKLSCTYPVVVDGSAMLPTFKEGDRLMLNTNLGELKRGDVVVNLYPKDTAKKYIKRIIALPNETIEIRQGVVFINGKQLDEPYLDQNFNQAQSNFASTKIEADNYFVMGDNRDNSSDSRFWGTVKKDLIQGTVSFKYAEGSKK